jgi:multiple sugar transport system ATP-binding protein
MAGIDLEHLSKRFGAVEVIRDMSLAIRDGEFMVLVGPSGCGKSTALRLIAGLEEATSGTISIGGRIVNDMPPKDRNIAMVFQNYALYPHMTVRENLDFGLKIAGTPRPERARLVDEVAEILGIGELMARKPKQLSGGQRQRVAVGRAIVRKPAAFLFDEPLSNLDAKLRLQMRADLGRLQQRLRTTSVYVTHDQVEAMTMGHRIAVMKDGELKQVGTPLELYESPGDSFVAQFIGTPPMNLLPGRIEEDGTGITAPGISLELPAPLRLAATRHRGRRVLAGVRPQHVRQRSGGEHARAVTAVIEALEPLGHEAILYTRVGDLPLVAVLAGERHNPKPGEQVELVIDTDALHLFDETTGKRLTA